MKFAITFKDYCHSWRETYIKEEISTLAQAEQWAENMTQAFNYSLRPNEPEREWILVKEDVLSEDEIQDAIVKAIVEAANVIAERFRDEFLKDIMTPTRAGKIFREEIVGVLLN